MYLKRFCRTLVSDEHVLQDPYFAKDKSLFTQKMFICLHYVTVIACLDGFYCNIMQPPT